MDVYKKCQNKSRNIGIIPLEQFFLECPINGCLQEVPKQVKENLAFPNLEGLLWIHV
jgi:hypothetical protein